jgi:hypothetical protein
MTPYIVMGIIGIGMVGLIPLVLHWDRQERERRR